MEGNELRRVRVWDLPTRLFHWTLALCVVGLFVTGKIGGEAMAWHGRLGYAVATLLLFRLTWGLVGGHWSRFTSFAYSPRVILEYLRGRFSAGPVVGHSPAGSASVYALLALLFVQVATGLFSADMEDFAGPLNVFISNAMARVVTSYHKHIGAPILIALVGLHIAAVTYYHLLHGQNLIGPMLHGHKVLPAPARASDDDWRSRVRAIVVLIIAACATAGLVSLGGN